MVENVAKKKIEKILVANRGEIAVRVLRACRELGIRGAAVYSDADRSSLPVLLADEAHRIGPAPSSESYLRGDAIVELAVSIGADAIHPGYGFVAENAEFAQLAEDNGVTFIGPSPAAIAAMGSKIESRRLMIDAGVPVVPGGRDALRDASAAAAAAAEMSYPILLKASAGGGGKGMRLVRSAEELPAAFREARAEAASSFGDDTLYLEKFVDQPRHVEIQILGDSYGHVVSLGERECSIQRRHQKVIEEAPSPVVDSELRRRMGDAAVKAARAVGYANAGTVEFLLDKSGEFYFLEMNTRLQVEHPITEMVTGVDLVIAQISIAAGERLGPGLDDLEPRGHAIEVRLYAEDPFNNFVPSPGRIELLHLPEGPGVRNDCGVVSGSDVPIYYDPMLAKLIVWGHDRNHAIARLERALTELRIEGVHTTAPLFRQILRDDDFRSGRLDNGMLDRKLASGEWAAPEATPGSEADLPLIAAAVAHAERQEIDTSRPAVGGGLRGHWKAAARQEALGGRPWS